VRVAGRELVIVRDARGLFHGRSAGKGPATIALSLDTADTYHEYVRMLTT
jgi:hypothetical protein